MGEKELEIVGYNIQYITIRHTSAVLFSLFRQFCILWLTTTIKVTIEAIAILL